MPAFRSCLAAAIALLCVALPATATQILHQSPEQLGRSAELVVRGRVEARQSYFADGGRRILTETTVAVEETFKGAAPARVTVVQAGGVVDGVRMTVHGALAWEEGEEVLLFLEPSLPGRHRVAGLSQGKFALERDAAGELLAVPAPLGGAELVGGAAARPMPLRELLRTALPALQEDRR